MGLVSRILLLGALFFAGTSPLFAQKKELIVGVENINYYPYYDFSGREHAGFFKEVMELFGKEKGYAVVFKPLPVKRLYTELLESGQIDFKFPDNPHWGGEYKKGKTIRYSDGVVMFIDGTLVQSEHAGEGIQSFHRLGTIAGFTPWTYMAHIDKGEVVNMENRSMSALLKTLLAGRIDGAYVNIAAARYVLDDTLVFGIKSSPNSVGGHYNANFSNADHIFNSFS